MRGHLFLSGIGGWADTGGIIIVIIIGIITTRETMGDETTGRDNGRLFGPPFFLVHSARAGTAASAAHSWGCLGFGC
jgi:hypothetical protein